MNSPTAQAMWKQLGTCQLSESDDRRLSTTKGGIETRGCLFPVVVHGHSRCGKPFHIQLPTVGERLAGCCSTGQNLNAAQTQWYESAARPAAVSFCVTLPRLPLRPPIPHSHGVSQRTTTAHSPSVELLFAPSQALSLAQPCTASPCQLDVIVLHSSRAAVRLKRRELRISMA